MKQKSFLLSLFVAAAIAFTGCSENDVPGGEGSVGELKITLDFKDVGAKGRADELPKPSTAIPPTSWTQSIKNLRAILHDNDGVIVYAKTINVTAANGAAQDINFTNVVTGLNYTFVALANVSSGSGGPTNHSDNIDTYGTGANANSEKEWTDSDLIGKKIGDLIIKYQGAQGFPAYATEDLKSKTAVKEPGEIFMGYATGIEITDGDVTTVATPVALKREVSLMRVRLDVSHENVATVDWTKKAAVFIYRLPNQMKVVAGNNGGSDKNSNINSIQFVEGFNSSEPTGYTGTMFPTDSNYDFTLWKDIIVFPNSAVRENTADGEANKGQKYFIVISGEAKAGHKDKYGEPVTQGDPVYWYAQVDGNFAPNFIRELNLIVETGGETEIPPTPQTYGDLKIKISAPAAWDSNIRSETKPL